MDYFILALVLLMIILIVSYNTLKRPRFDCPWCGKKVTKKQHECPKCNLPLFKDDEQVARIRPEDTYKRKY